MRPIKEPRKLNQLGNYVAIDLDKIDDRIPQSLIEQIRKDPNGEIIDYKMTDGQGIGIIIKFKNGKQSWFFEEEIKFSENMIDDSYDKALSMESIETKVFNVNEEKVYTTSKYISELCNPLKFLNWLLYSIGDVF